MSIGFYVGRAALKFGQFLHEFLGIQINLLSDPPKLSITLPSHRSHGILQSFPKVLAHDLPDNQRAFKTTECFHILWYDIIPRKNEARALRKLLLLFSHI